MRFLALLALPLLASAGDNCHGDSCDSRDVPTDSSLLQTGHPSKAAPRSTLTPGEAQEAERARQTLVLETDLEQVVRKLASTGNLPKARSVSASKNDFRMHAEFEFKRMVTHIGLLQELTGTEFRAFRTRFTSAMMAKRNSIESDHDWSLAAGAALETEKPLMPAALVKSLNSASLGFTAKMWEWLALETKGTSEKMLGFKPRSENRKSVYRRKDTARQYFKLPSAFRAEEKWPACRDAILRIHNQGHCGSCWAFSGLAPVDARMCIATNGAWIKSEHTLSRLQALSCAPFSNPEWADVSYFDGCQGGEPAWVLDMMADRGVVSTSCLPYYITGEGVEHFSQSRRGPPCVSHCQQNYDMTLEKDSYVSPGVGRYDQMVDVHGDSTMVANMKIAMYTEGPVSFAFKVTQAFFGYSEGVFSSCDGTEMANHAVYAFGWGEYAADGHQIEFIEALNSWGTRWGANGSFRIHPICLCEVVVPGPIESTIMGHDVQEVNDFWPFAKPEECPTDADGCVTDMEGSGNYTSSEMCFSNSLNGKMIRIEEFSLEANYDFVIINGHRFSGGTGTGLDVNPLITSIVVDANGLKFQADTALQFPGFKLCPVDPPIDTGNGTNVNESDVDPPC